MSKKLTSAVRKAVGRESFKLVVNQVSMRLYDKYRKDPLNAMKDEREIKQEVARLVGKAVTKAYGRSLSQEDQKALVKGLGVSQPHEEPEAEPEE